MRVIVRLNAESEKEAKDGVARGACSSIIQNLFTKAGIFICKRYEDQSFQEKDEEQKEMFLSSEFNLEKDESFCSLGDMRCIMSVIQCSIENKVSLE